MLHCVAPVQEIYFVKENATTEEQLTYSSHLHDVSLTSKSWDVLLYYCQVQVSLKFMYYKHSRLI